MPCKAGGVFHRTKSLCWLISSYHLRVGLWQPLFASSDFLDLPSVWFPTHGRRKDVACPPSSQLCPCPHFSPGGFSAGKVQPRWIPSWMGMGILTEWLRSLHLKKHWEELQMSLCFGEERDISCPVTMVIRKLIKNLVSFWVDTCELRDCWPLSSRAHPPRFHLFSLQLFLP